MPTPSFTVTIPAQDRYARVLRLMASAAGAAAGLAVDRLDDLKLAVDEAVGALLTGRAPAALSCSLVGSDGSLAIRITGDGAAGAEWPPAGWDESLPALVLEGVADGVVLAAGAAGPSVTFTVG